MPFLPNALYFGITFAVLWGLIMQLLAYLQGSTVDYPLLRSLIAGSFFGVSMAAYFAYSRRKHKLPTWAELGSSDGHGA